jgi:hypothetical protein
MWSSDDGLYSENSLSEVLDLAYKIDKKDGIIIRYAEGVNRNGNCPDDSYWVGYTHDDQRLPGINPGWNIAPVALYKTELFYSLGGFDCKFEHINMSTHDLAYRIQKNGGKFYKSPSLVLSCDWSPGHLNQEEHQPIHNCHFDNDIPYFNFLYQGQSDRINIDYNNWKTSQEIWRRFK